MSRLTTSFSPLVRSTSTEGSCNGNAMVSGGHLRAARSPPPACGIAAGRPMETERGDGHQPTDHSHSPVVDKLPHRQHDDQRERDQCHCALRTSVTSAGSVLVAPGESKSERNAHAPPNPVLILTSSIVCCKLPASADSGTLNALCPSVLSRTGGEPNASRQRRTRRPTHLAERIDPSYREPPAHLRSVPSFLRPC